ncbi:MAG: hypothetical protein JW993_11665 [Sedimentisphaerales bacterium]|nr:hypothetical protein [Sedimentisphaerales bacterium]
MQVKTLLKLRADDLHRYRSEECRLRVFRNRVPITVLCLTILALVGGGCTGVCPSAYYVAGKWTPDGWVEKYEFTSGEDENIYFVVESPHYGLEVLVIQPEKRGAQPTNIPRSRFRYREDCCPPSDSAKDAAKYLHTRCPARVDCCWVEVKVSSLPPGSYLVWWELRGLNDPADEPRRRSVAWKFYVK